MSSRLRHRSQPSLDRERALLRDGFRAVGVDEAGRGCLAGPVVAAAVVLPDELVERGLSSEPSGKFWEGVDDSKRLSPAKREELSGLIVSRALVQVAWAYPEEIDRCNILHASMLAMRRALRAFAGHARAALVDGHLSPYAGAFLARLPEPAPFARVEPVVGGDRHALSIAAASIVAKVYRDRWMSELGRLFPNYGFADHKGYPTPAHYAAIARHGPCPIHRRSFAPFRDRAAS